jgi:hypothetical protein
MSAAASPPATSKGVDALSERRELLRKELHALLTTWRHSVMPASLRSEIARWVMAARVELSDVSAALAEQRKG